MNNKITYINISEIELDIQSQRLPELFKNKNICEQDIIDWLLINTSVIGLMLSIGQMGFFVGEAIFVIENEDGNYTVIDGNRRVLSAKLLNNPDLGNINIKKINQVLSETTERPQEIPCIVFQKREDTMQYLGYKHITGIKPWSILSKARYLSTLAKGMELQPINTISRELAKVIGSKSYYTKRLLVGYKIYEIIKDNDFYGIPDLNESSFYFHYISDSLRYDNIRFFLSIDFDSEDPFEKFNEKGKQNLQTLVDWFFRKNEQNRSRVYGC